MLGLKQGVAMKTGFHGIDRKRVLSGEKQATDAAKTGRWTRQVAQALVMVAMKLEVSR